MEPRVRETNRWTGEQVAAALQAAKTKLERARQKLHEPLAVVGIGCRFPGASDPQDYWRLLEEGHCPIGMTPPDRWDHSLAASREKDPGKITANQGAFLKDVDQWDAGFFGISRREAASLDPQHRLLMTVTWEALEHAGLDPDELRGSRTGVFVGMCSNDYLHRLTTRDLSQIDAYLGTGNAHGAAAGRLSYFLNWQGPCTAIDTACSSSLTAVHLAVRSLRANDCDMALVGGVNLIFAPELSVNLSQSGMLSPTGRCQAFAASADGFVRGEGCGVLLLKRLSDAQAAGDRIVCLLRGSAVNQDGRSNGLTAPNGVAQQNVIRAALADAQLQPQEIDYIEAHGTGTALGDPIEMGALGAVFAPQRAAQRPLLVGSVKTNIGHLEGAAGVAGLIKACLAVSRGQIPPHLHFERPSPHIDWSLPLQVPTRLTAWPASDRPRRAGVSSFGFGGTNAHVIVEQAERPDRPPTTHHQAVPAADEVLLVLSAKTPTALAAQARQYAHQLPPAALAEIAYTASVGRAHFPYRLALTAGQHEQVRQTLQAFAEQPAADAPAVLAGQAARDFSLVMLFAGQGVRLHGAGRAVHQRSGPFRQAWEACRTAAADYWPVDISALLWDDRPAPLEQQVDAQIVAFCLQVAWARHWQAWGLEPRAVLGHSLGEYAAAHLAGVFSLADALRLVSARARLLRDQAAPGGMLAVRAPEEQVRPLLDAWPGELDIAALNGPRQTVVAGTTSALAALESRLSATHVRSRRLPTTHAFHSPLVEPLLDDFAAVARQVQYAEPQIPYVSAVTGRWANREVACGEYWCRHLRQTVRFAPALACLMETAPTLYLEVGVGTTLAGLVRSAARPAQAAVLPGLAAQGQEWSQYLRQLGRLYVHGAPLAWRALWHQPPDKVTLPTYPFESQPYWFTTAATAPPPAATATAPPPAATATAPPPAAAETAPGRAVHPLLGRRLDLASREIVYETDLRACAYLQDHRLGGTAVFPAAGYLELALAAGQDAGFRLLDVRELKIRRPLPLDGPPAARVQVVLTPQEAGFHCRILRWTPTRWQTHATCRLETEIDAGQPDQPARTATPHAQAPPRSVADHYTRCRALGLDYGPAFQGLRQLSGGSGQAWGQAALPATLDPHGYLLHPALLDACFQVTATALEQPDPPHPDGHATPPASWLPTRIQRLALYRAADHLAPLRVHASLRPADSEQSLYVDLFATDLHGDAVFQVEAMRLTRVSNLASVPDTSNAEEADVAEQRRDAPAEDVADNLSELGDAERHARLLAHVRSRIAEIMESQVEEVPVDQQLDTLGLDSLMAFELREEIKQSLGVDISLEVFLQDVTLVDLSSMLSDRLKARDDGPYEVDFPGVAPASRTMDEGLIEGAI